MGTSSAAPPASAATEGLSTGSPGRADLASRWLDDLAWHQHAFRRSRFQWTAEHVLSVVTRHTGGQLEFTAPGHLNHLQHYQDQVTRYGQQVRLAMADPLAAAHHALGMGWAPVSAVLGLTSAECLSAQQFALGQPPEGRTNPDVGRVRRLLRPPFVNPLVEAWELKQLWRLYQAAADVLEDVFCDLIDEVSRQEPLPETIAGLRCSPQGLQRRLCAARNARGEPGDARRVPEQRF